MADIMDHLPVHTTTETVGLGSRLKSSCCGILLGILLFLGSFPLLFWNESRAVARYDALEEAESRIVLLGNPLTLDANNDGKLVHFAARVSDGGSSGGGSSSSSSSFQRDPLFGIGCGNGTAVPECVALQRHSEMYQWKERTESSTKTNTGGSKTTSTDYYYDKTWQGTLISSASFYDTNSNGNHKNPTSFRYPSLSQIANPMMAGAVSLPPAIAEYFAATDRVRLMVTPADIPDATLRKQAKPQGGNGILYFGSGTEQSPQIGDEKVYFTATPSGTITVVGLQTDNSVGAFVSASGRGGDVLLYRKGNLTSAEMFDIAEGQNQILTWVLRLAGFAAMAIGQILVWNPLRVVADVVPFVGGLVGSGIAFVSVLVASILSSITIAIAWLIVHPVIGAIFLGAALLVIGCCAVGIKTLLNKQKQQQYDATGDNDDFVSAEAGFVSSHKNNDDHREDNTNHNGMDDFANALDD